MATVPRTLRTRLRRLSLGDGLGCSSAPSHVPSKRSISPSRFAARGVISNGGLAIT
jgi:hypothetical protein